MSDDRFHEDNRETDSFADGENTPDRAGGRFSGGVVGQWREFSRYLETLPPSKRFFVTMTGLLGGLLLLASIFFGLRALFGPSKPSYDNQTLYEAFAGLDATFHADNAKINEELMLIVDDLAASNQLMHKGVAAENDFALAMRNEFRTIAWDKHLPYMRRYVSRNPWRLGFLEIKSQMHLLTLADEKRLNLREVLDSPNVDMQPAYTIDQFGFTLDEKDRDNLWGYVHLEEYELARALTGLTLQNIRETNEAPKLPQADMAQAIDALRYILKAAEVASHQKEMNLRFDAAFIRENALDTMNALVQHPQFTMYDAREVLRILEGQLANWPLDALAFEGERTAGVWIYEQTRRGHLLDLLAPQDAASLQHLDSLVSIAQSIRRNVDTDEIYYLTRMSEIIFLCGKPYHERFHLLVRRDDELDALRDDLAAYPALAGAVLLRDVRKIMHSQATDLARTEGWTLALAASLKQTSAHVGTHPMTGQPYRVRVTADPNSPEKKTVSVSWLDTEEPVVIPVFSTTGRE